ncbi:hypothetical protein PRN20_03560 [Devosia sp. ZB163]|uniref:hypothetical protein n=1 Tax=Devosia sp. ZB163 TaxID=3025938 RepID=UPI00236042B1|nr:hypothetical protein [Devosia sp. ZB163]MDC9822799.1 hypothetical protein [Devosia sp. ZB163]
MASPIRAAAAIAALGALTLVGGCAYDYLQRTDRVGYSAGDAVKANMAKQTVDPSKKTMYSTTGLGKNGVIASESDVVIGGAAATPAN